MPRQHCTNFPDIAQENSPKDKIVRNKFMILLSTKCIKVCLMRLVFVWWLNTQCPILLYRFIWRCLYDLNTTTEKYSEVSQISKMELFAKVFKNLKMFDRVLNTSLSFVRILMYGGVCIRSTGRRAIFAFLWWFYRFSWNYYIPPTE